LNYIDVKYINLLSPLLRNFKYKGYNKWNFSCPYCGDSKTNKRKARGYIYIRKGKYQFHCHNCGITKSIETFIKHLNPTLFNEYYTEKFITKERKVTELDVFIDKMKKPSFASEDALKKLVKVSSLDSNDPVKKFVIERKIPNEYHYKLFSCPKFMSYTNSILPNKFSEDNLKYEGTRLLIPFINKEGKVHAFQGRTINDDKIKYITIVLDENTPKIYGLDTVDESTDIYVLEGPIDSMFVNNAVATAGGDLSVVKEHLPKDKTIIVYDNEPRAKHTISKINKAISNGYRVVIWPESFTYKDVNEAIISGITKEEIAVILSNNTFSGLAAELELIKWRKI